MSAKEKKMRDERFLDEGDGLLVLTRYSTSQCAVYVVVG